MTDDQTTVYVLETRKHFEDLRQVAAQLAGWLVLSAAGADSASPDHPVLAAGRRLLEESSDALKSVRPPARAAEHHRHLLRAASAIGAAFADLNAALIPLKQGYAELERAAALLPGFELVNFAGACCAAHAI